MRVRALNEPNKPISGPGLAWLAKIREGSARENEGLARIEYLARLAGQGYSVPAGTKYRDPNP